MTVAFWLSMYIVQYFVTIYLFHRIDYIYTEVCDRQSGLVRLFAAAGPIGWLSVIALVLMELIANESGSIAKVLNAPERLIVSLARRNK